MRSLLVLIICISALSARAQYSYTDLITMGERLVQENKMDSAQQVFYKALAIQEGAEAYYGLGFILSTKCHDLGVNCDDAIRYLLKSKNIDSTYRRQDYNIAVCYIKKSNYSEALKYLNLAIAKDATDPDYYANRAIVRQKLGDEKGYKKDVKTYEKMFKKKK